MGSIILVNAHLHLHVEALRPFQALHFAFILYKKRSASTLLHFFHLLSFLSHFLSRLHILFTIFIVMNCQQHRHSHTPSLPSIDVMLQDAPSLTRKHQKPLSSALLTERDLQLIGDSMISPISQLWDIKDMSLTLS